MSKEKTEKKMEEKYLVLKNGKKLKITGETGRYYITEKCQYRKSSREVEKVITKQVKKEQEE